MNANESAEPVDQTVSGSSNQRTGAAVDHGKAHAATQHAYTAPALAGALATALAKAMLDDRQAPSSRTAASTAQTHRMAPTAPATSAISAGSTPSPDPTTSVDPVVELATAEGVASAGHDDLVDDVHPANTPSGPEAPPHPEATPPTDISQASLPIAAPAPASDGPPTSPAAVRADAALALARSAHDDLLAGLGRRFRGVTLKVDFELSTPLTRQVFRRDFVYVSQQLHALEASRRVQGLNRQLLNDALMAVERHGDVVKTLLKQLGNETRTLIALHGNVDAQVESAPPARLQATVISPYARTFIDLLRTADDALAQLDRAWLLGLLEPAAKAQRTSDCRKALQGFKEVVRQQRHVVGEHVREVNAARRLRRDDVFTPSDTSRALGPRQVAGRDADRLDDVSHAGRNAASGTLRSTPETPAVAGESMDDSDGP